MNWRRGLRNFLIAHQGTGAAIRGGTLFLLGVLLLLNPLWGRSVLVWLLFLLFFAMALLCFRLAWRAVKSWQKKFAVGIGLASLLCTGALFLLPQTTVALWGAILGVLIAECGLFAGVFSRRTDWPHKLAAGAAGGLTILLVIMLISGRKIAFFAAADLLGVFFISLGILTLALLPDRKGQ